MSDMSPLELHLRFVADEDNHPDPVAVLWSDAIGDIGGHRVGSTEDFQILRDIGEVSSRAREIYILSNGDEAEAIARKAHADGNVATAMTWLGAGIWSVGVLHRDGQYDNSGMPSVTDLRKTGPEVIPGREVVLEGNLTGATHFSMMGPGEILLVSPAPPAPDDALEP